MQQQRRRSSERRRYRLCHKTRSFTPRKYFLALRKRGMAVQIPGSVLELMFSGRWEDRVDRDKDGLVFLDYDPYLFSIILRYLIALHNYGMAADHLRLRPIESYLEEEFRLMLSHLGLSQIIQPAFEFKWSPVLKTQNVKLCNRDSVAISQGDGLLRHHALSHDVFYGGVFKFNVYVDFLEEWAMLGIIGSDVHLTTSDNACNDASTYGWGSNGEVFVQGIESSKKGYPGRPFKTGDHLTLVLDGRYSTLTMKTCVDDVTLEYKIPNLMGKEWRLVLATYYGSSAIEVTSN